MSILINKQTRVIVQGITGHQGRFHTQSMLDYGSRIVAGVTPGKGGQEILGIPVYNSISEVREKADAAIIFVPAKFTAQAVNTALDAGLKTIVVITEGVPVHDSMKFVSRARENGVTIIGPNTPGLITVGECKLGIMPSAIFSPGPVGIISRSGTLTYEVVSRLSHAGIGQSTAVGLGGDPIVGTDYADILNLFAKDEQTKAVVVIGEIGGDAEEKMADYIKESAFPKPVIAYVAGQTAPPGKRMGHAGAIISGSAGTYQSKVQALKAQGAEIMSRPADVVEIMRRVLG